VERQQRLAGVENLQVDVIGVSHASGVNSYPAIFQRKTAQCAIVALS